MVAGPGSPAAEIGLQHSAAAAAFAVAAVAAVGAARTSS
jgi:hypothetical protein